MASYHLSVGVGKKGSGGAHASYVSRSGEYENFKGTEELVLSEHGNMPSWAEHDPTEFFRQADLYERKNGSVYREYEIAIPNELTTDQQIEFVREFVQQEIGENHPYLFGIHNHRATIDGTEEQPHAHIMFSDRKLDGIERNPEEFFKRYNSKNPEKGGCQKANAAASKEERKEKLVALRERFASLQNAHLEKHGHYATVTHLSLKDQGIARSPERHLGPVDSRDGALVRTLKEFRVASIMLDVENAMVKTIDLTSSITAALAERKQHERASRDKHPSRSQAPTGLDSLRTVWGSDNIHHQKLPQMLLQQDAPLNVRQPGREEPAYPDLYERDTVAERSIVEIVELAAQAAAEANARAIAQQAARAQPRPQSRYHPDNIAKREAEELAKAEANTKLPLRPTQPNSAQRAEETQAKLESKPAIQEHAKTRLDAFLDTRTYKSMDGKEYAIQGLAEEGSSIYGSVVGCVNLQEGDYTLVHKGRLVVALIKGVVEIGSDVEGVIRDGMVVNKKPSVKGMGFSR